MSADGPPEPGMLDVVVVGGGPTGVETTGALAELMNALSSTGQLDVPGQITIVDHGSALLGQFSSKAHRYVVKKLTDAGAEIKLESGVTPVASPGSDDHSKSVRSTDSPRATKTVATISGGNRPCSTTPGVEASS